MYVLTYVHKDIPKDIYKDIYKDIRICMLRKVNVCNYI